MEARLCPRQGHQGPVVLVFLTLLPLVFSSALHTFALSTWSAAGGKADRTGRTYTTGPSSGMILLHSFSFNLPSRTPLIGGQGNIYSLDSGGTLYAFSSDGEPLWRSPGFEQASSLPLPLCLCFISPPSSPSSSSSSGHDVLFVQKDGATSSSSPSFVAINGTDGGVLWEQSLEAEGSVYGCVTTPTGVYAAANSTVRRFDVLTGAPITAQLLAPNASPVSVDELSDRLYLTVGNVLYSFHASNLSLIWNVTIHRAKAIDNPPLIGNGTAFLTYDAPTGSALELATVAPSGTVSLAFQIFTAKDGLYSMPSMSPDGEHVYNTYASMSEHAGIYSHGSDGIPEWAVSSLYPARPTNLIVDTDGTTYACFEHLVLAYDSFGAIVSSFDLPSTGRCLGLAMDGLRGRLVVTTDDARTHVLGPQEPNHDSGDSDWPLSWQMTVVVVLAVTNAGGVMLALAIGWMLGRRWRKKQDSYDILQQE